MPVSRSIVAITPFGLRGAPALGLLVIGLMGIINIAGTDLFVSASVLLTYFFLDGCCKPRDCQ